MPIATTPTLQELANEFVRVAQSMIEVRAAELAREIARTAIEQVLAGQIPSATAAKRPPSKGRVLQGQYIGRLRKLKGTARARVQRVARDEGVAAAIKLADKLAG